MVRHDLENVVSGGRGKLRPVHCADFFTGNATESAHAINVRNLVVQGCVSTTVNNLRGM